MIKYNRWIRGVLLFSFILIFMYSGTIFAQSSTNYQIKKSVIDQGGAASQSPNHAVVDAVGQPSTIGLSFSTNYQVMAGFFAEPAGTPTVQPNIACVAPETAQTGQEFWVAIVVGDPNPVVGLFGVSFDLNYPTSYIDFVQVQFTNPGTGPGNLLGTDLVTVDQSDDPNGKVSIGISRKSGQGGVNGSGPVVWLKFVSRLDTPDLTTVNWSLSNISANDAGGNSITLDPVADTTIIQAGCIVWPGDTNNNGVVNAADVLPIGLYFGTTGPQRPGASLSWTGQSAPCWIPENATYADANGLGSVGAEDVLAIGLNWEKTHSISLAKRSQKMIQSLTANTIKPLVTWASGDSFKVEIQVTEVTELFGIAFDLIYSTDRPEVEVLSVFADPFIGTDLVFFSQINANTKTVNLGISRKAGQGGVSGSGAVAFFYFKGNLTAPLETTVGFELQNITANDASGNTIALTAETGSFVTQVESELEQSGQVPGTFALLQNYPNPFNPETEIRFQLPVASHAVLKIFNTVGQEIQRLVDRTYEAGYHRVRWNGNDKHGNQVSSGVYLYQLQAGKFMQVKKMSLLR